MVGGAEAEFEAFAAREGKRLLGFALLLTGDWQDAEDLVQLALLRSASRWPAARGVHPGGPGEPGPGSVASQAPPQYRNLRRRAGDKLPAASGDVTAAVLDRQLLLRACRLLPVQQRAVLVLRFWEDRSVDETAAVLGCTASTVKSHTHRALARLRLALQEAPEPQVSLDRKETPC